MLSGQVILITGGTGSLGRAVVRMIVSQYPDAQKIKLFSRDELKHQECKLLFTEYSDQLEYIIGDVRDYDRLEEAMAEVDVVIHAAAMKQVGSCEENPGECYKTNVVGTQNAIKAAKKNGVKKFLFISSDKAVEPISVYGNSKQAGESFVLSQDQVTCAVVRLGNLLGSSGSVVQVFENLKRTGSLPITSKEATRFCGSLENGSSAVEYSLKMMQGGEIFIPKWKSFRVIDLAESVAPGCQYNIIGLSRYEKLHEKLIGKKESDFSLENNNFYTIPMNNSTINQALDDYYSLSSKSEFYSSDSVDHLSIEELKLLINKCAVGLSHIKSTL